jgi:flagellar biosynthesis protein FliR
VAIVRAAVLIAAPALAVSLTVQVGLAAVARVVPRLAGFSLAFPVVFAAAIVVTLTGIPLFAPMSAHPWFVLPWAVPR